MSVDLTRKLDIPPSFATTVIKKMARLYQVSTPLEDSLSLGIKSAWGQDKRRI